MISLLGDRDARKMLLLLGPLDEATTEKRVFDWMFKKYQTSREVCVQRLMQLEQAGLITYRGEVLEATSEGRDLVARLLKQEEESPLFVLSEQQGVILRTIVGQPLTVDALSIRCFRDLGPPHGSLKAARKALRPLRDRGLAAPVGRSPLVRWTATDKGRCVAQKSGRGAA